jgi:hypothetical protein
MLILDPTLLLTGSGTSGRVFWSAASGHSLLEQALVGLPVLASYLAQAKELVAR